MAAHSCSKCTNTWGGLAQCHCATCHNTFSGITAFDRHRSHGKCKKPEDLGLELRGNIWAFPTDTDWNAQFGRSDHVPNLGSGVVDAIDVVKAG